MNEWQRQYLQDLDMSREHKLYDFAKEYHDRCEAYDRTVCTGPIGRDGILPMHPSEQGKSTRNALAVLADIATRAALEGLERDELQRAISRFRS